MAPLGFCLRPCRQIYVEVSTDKAVRIVFVLAYQRLYRERHLCRRCGVSGGAVNVDY